MAILLKFINNCTVYFPQKRNYWRFRLISCAICH
uniref:Uncharacterized protein n=1 Tax=Arundo donax TaxID=35708 RepID=A0A0A9BXS5_ARUDO